MKLGMYILWVWGQNFYEAEFWISVPAPHGAIPNFTQSEEMTHPDWGAYYS